MTYPPLILTGPSDNRALTSLNVSSNNLTRGTLKPNGWADEKGYEARWGERDDHWETDMSGVATLADAIKNMRALTSLDISNQADKYGCGGLGAEGAKHLAEALKDHP
jgi:hypothetical protein